MLRGLTFALLFAPLFLFAQADFRKGYVIKNNGDTIRGYINVRSWDNNPEAVSFKTSINNEARKMGIDEIQYFQVGGVASYKRFMVPISLGEVELDKISPEVPDTSTTTGTVFLKVELAGNLVNLYSYTDKIKTRYYISEGNSDTPKELGYIVYFTDGNRITSIKSYTSQLLTIAEKQGKLTDALRKKVLTAQYELSDLKAICSVLNNYIMPESKKETETVSKIPASNFFAGIGVNMQTASYSGESNLSSASHKVTPSPRISFGLAAYPNRITQRLGFIAGISAEYTKTDIKGNDEYANINYNPYYSKVIHKISQFNLAFSPGVIYNLYNRASLKWFVGAAMNINYSIYPENKLISTRISTSTGEEFDRTEEDDVIKLENFWISFPVRTGFTFNRKITAFAQYNPASAITKYVYYSVSVGGFSAGIEYNFPHHRK